VRDHQEIAKIQVKYSRMNADSGFSRGDWGTGIDA
jgi:hypothetical protein